MFSSVWLLLLPLVLASKREDHKDIVANTRLRLRFLNDFFFVTNKAWFPKAIGDPRKRTEVPFDESTAATDSQSTQNEVSGDKFQKYFHNSV